MKGLPKGSALTAIFDSCTSGTLLGNVPSIRTRCSLPLIPRKTSVTISATMYIDRGLTRENVQVLPCKTTSVSLHRTSLTRLLTPSTVRKDGEYARSGPQGRRCSIYLRRGSRDMNNFLGLDRYAIRTMDERATTVLEPSANDLDYHRGQRHMSSELPSECDGWCRTTVSGTALEYPDMVSWYFNHSPTPWYLPSRFS